LSGGTEENKKMSARIVAVLGGGGISNRAPPERKSETLQLETICPVKKEIKQEEEVERERK
jgi:hypothetical protein